ncbi:MAG: tyrosine-type recombinase/integrase [Gemmatimonadaceae bacterium]
MTRSDFADALVKRLRIRKHRAKGDIYVLDLRHGRFGHKNPRIVRDPTDPGWPFKGRATSDLNTAKRWVRDNYAPQLDREIEAAQAAPDSAALTVKQAAEQYISARMEVLGKEGIRSINSRVSMLRGHVIPAFGKIPLAALTRHMVRIAAEGLTVSKPAGLGKRTTAPAQLGTKRQFRAAVMVLWYHIFPDLSCPFAGVRLSSNRDDAELRRTLAEGDFSKLLAPESGAMTPAEFRRALTGALYYDTEMGRRPNLRSLIIPNTVSAMVIQTALGLRIGELIALRWGHINFEQGYALVTGTKTQRSFRIVPLQEQLVPWLEELRTIESRSPDPRSFVIRSHPLRGSLTPATHTTLVNRYARALKYSGLKRPKKSTHWARATHATWGSTATAIITTEALKAYLGHKTRYGGSTDAYIHVMLEIMPAEHRRYIRHIPSPEEVREALKTFEPVELVPWRDRRVWQSRSNAARKAQHERALARKPMYDKLDAGVRKAASPIRVAFGFASRTDDSDPKATGRR